MNKTIFVTGATGHIGSHVARTFRAAGYRVLGLTRNGAQELQAGDIEPVIGSMESPESWRAAAESADILIHAAADYTGDTFALDRQAVVDLLAVRRKTGARFIYTSGIWMAGHSGGRILDETDSEGIEHVGARKAIEPLVLEQGGIVIRPGVVYGERGGLTAGWFSNTPVVGDGRNHWAMINVEDLAVGYLLAAEKAADGDLFHIVDDSRLTVAEMVNAARKAAGISAPIEWIPFETARETFGTSAEALALDQLVTNAKARQVLGWQPDRPGFVTGAERYFAELAGAA